MPYFTYVVLLGYAASIYTGWRVTSTTTGAPPEIARRTMRGADLAMKPPIFIVCANGDICTYRSARVAESALESPDVESGEYTCGFDSIGTRLTIGVTEPTRVSRLLGITSLGLTPVTIEPTGEPGAGAGELRALLASQPEDASADLASLVERAARTAEGHP